LFVGLAAAVDADPTALAGHRSSSGSNSSSGGASAQATAAWQAAARRRRAKQQLVSAHLIADALHRLAWQVHTRDFRKTRPGCRPPPRRLANRFFDWPFQKLLVDFSCFSSRVVCILLREALCAWRLFRHDH
jgi:hypothetical protein